MSLEKQVLVCVDGSTSSDRALDYLGLMEGAMIRELRVTLFYIMGPIPPYLRREAEKDSSAFRRLDALRRSNMAEADRVLAHARERLMRHGLEDGQIELKSQPRTSDVARDILFEAEQHLYDAVLMGRRGLSKAQEMFVGSVTNKVVQHAERVPVWVVGGRVTSLKVLCAVDGSDGALRAVDHMAFMLGENPECRITLFHVGAHLANYCTLDFASAELGKQIEGDLMTGEAECMDDFYPRAVKVLEEAGLSADQIETKSVEGGLSVPGAIIDEARRGDYGTVVVGRRGENRSFFLGHVSDKIVSRYAEAAVWVVG